MKYLLSIFISFLLLTEITAEADTNQDDFTKHAENLVISDSVLSHSQCEGRNFITVIGKIKSRSAVTLQNIAVEIQFYDSDKVLIDSVSEELYIIIPPSEEMTFRVREVADKVREQYAHHVIKVVGAEQKETNQSSSRTNFSALFISWFPMLLLIIIWLFFIRQMRKNTSPQNRSIALIEQQNNLFMNQNELLERLVSAVEKNMEQLRGNK